MLPTSTDLCLYNITLKSQTNSLKALVGNFSGKKSQELVIATSSSIKIYRLNTSTGKLNLLNETPAFAIIKSVTNFKIAGSGKDYLAVTSDSGNLSILEYNLESSKFEALFNEPYSKTGIRRLSPGYELASDAKGRAILATALEKNKLCYVLNRGLENNLTISSPLEANRSKILTLCSVGLDVGYDNPLFATIEIDYSEYENNTTTDFKRSLTFYELDLGLNHLIRKKTIPISSTSNLLVQVPGGNDGPSGVLVFSENLVSYKNLDGLSVSIQIPRLKGDSTSVFVVSAVVHKMKNRFFFLVQTNLGDIFKVDLPVEDSINIAISYFDTIPLASSLIIFKSGFFFVDTEVGDKLLFQFEKLGSDNPFVSTTDKPIEELTFERNQELDNILLVDILESLNPVLDSKLITKTSSTSLYTLSGLKDQSFLKILQYGSPINEIVETDLPNLAQKVWTTKLSKRDDFDKYLIITFIDTTLVLSIGENVEEVTDSGILLTEQTLDIKQIGTNSISQVHSNGIRVLNDGAVTNEWLPPAGIKILTASSTNRQLAIGLSNSELVYFEVDEFDRLIEYNEHKEFQSRILSISLGEIPEGLLRSPFLVVGCQDSTIRVLSTAPDSTLDSLSLQALTSTPVSVLIANANNNHYVNIGLENGVYIRTLLDERTGQLTDSRTKYLGTKPVVLNRISVNNNNIVLAMSSKTWIINELAEHHLKISPLLINPLTSGAIFSSEDFTNGIVGVYKRKLIIFTLDEISNDFSSNQVQLETSPKFLLNDNDVQLFIVESSKDSKYLEKFDISTNEIIGKVQLETSETILAASLVKFESKKQSYILLSVATDYDPSTKSYTETFIVTYDLNLNLIHKTKITNLAFALTNFSGKLLVGSGNQLKLFDMGLKQLLSKASSVLESISEIVKLETQGFRVYVGDINESVSFAVYNERRNDFIAFADDVLSRKLTTIRTLDYDTVIGGDKFGNLFVLRADEETSQLSNSNLLLTKDGYLNGAPKKLKNVFNFFNEDIVTSFNKGALSEGGNDLVIYTGIQGTIGALIPILTRPDIKFFNNLQKAIRNTTENIFGRSHLKYRGYYQPVKNFIDGDLVEQYIDLPESLQVKIAHELEKTPRSILKKIHEIRLLSL